VRFADARERRLDLLGDLVEQYVDVEGLLDLVRSGAPPCLPRLPPGGVA
jgi:adenosylcobyric acid synthase